MTWHIAQLNVAHPLAPIDSPQLEAFVAQLDEINALAERSAGFVWRLASASGNATDIQVQDEPALIVNLTVWQSVEALFDFTYRTAHAKVMARRREWFARAVEAWMVLWWIPAGQVPTLAEARARLAHLREHGPSAHAFTFKERHPAPPDLGPPVDMKPERYCTP
jgi:hypothetical protein